MHILRRGAMAVLMLQERVAFNSWIELVVACENAVVRSLRKFGPDARLVRRAFAKLQAIMGGRQRLLRAVAGFTRRSELRALRAWRFSKRNFQRNGMLLHFSAVSEHAIARTTHPWRVSPAIIIVFHCLLMHVCRHAC